MNLADPKDGNFSGLGFTDFGDTELRTFIGQLTAEGGG